MYRHCQHFENITVFSRVLIPKHTYLSHFCHRFYKYIFYNAIIMQCLKYVSDTFWFDTYAESKEYI